MHMDADRNIRRTALPNGLTIITEEMEHIRSVCIGIWVKTGSRDEDKQWNGISHFVEHMVFKGTEHRTAEEIARQVDSIGGKVQPIPPTRIAPFASYMCGSHHNQPPAA